MVINLKCLLDSTKKLSQSMNYFMNSKTWFCLIDNFFTSLLQWTAIQFEVMWISRPSLRKLMQVFRIVKVFNKLHNDRGQREVPPRNVGTEWEAGRVESIRLRILVRSNLRDRMAASEDSRSSWCCTVPSSIYSTSDCIANGITSL